MFDTGLHINEGFLNSNAVLHPCNMQSKSVSEVQYVYILFGYNTYCTSETLFDCILQGCRTALNLENLH